ncbi:ATP-binding protein [Streptomyces sp. GC420]|uniref:ATP-binding protein n=1 Tax=Streptomyces sp. GC420 TaxID=2697568 RepID=UPI00141521D5|nr:ATP-binding protein [Streptomyces sp. GC420]NBM16202.1 ATP-binding protein [Streptomyces sp. GC420]
MGALRPLTLELLATAKAVPEIRRTVREHIGAPCADLQLCVSELLTNVVRHLGDGVPVTVRVARAVDGRTRLEVTDPDPRASPVLCRAAADDETGRGLALLDAVALCWGVDQGPGTKTVWCELPTGAAAPALVDPRGGSPTAHGVPKADPDGLKRGSSVPYRFGETVAVDGRRLDTTGPVAHPDTF